MIQYSLQNTFSFFILHFNNRFHFSEPSSRMSDMNYGIKQEIKVHSYLFWGFSLTKSTSGLFDAPHQNVFQVKLFHLTVLPQHGCHFKAPIYLI